MSSDAEVLTPPLLLVAMPQIQEPFFRQSVVLLVDHQPEGSFGLILNRPTELSVAEVLSGLDIDWAGGETWMTHFGGPVQPQLGSVLFDPAAVALDNPEETVLAIREQVALTQHIGDLARLAAAPPTCFRLLLGYAGWGEGQLDEELERNDWLIAPLSVEILFAAETATIWQRALASIDVEPENLPASVLDSGSESVN